MVCNFMHMVGCLGKQLMPTLTATAMTIYIHAVHLHTRMTTNMKLIQNERFQSSSPASASSHYRLPFPHYKPDNTCASIPKKNNYEYNL